MNEMDKETKKACMCMYECIYETVKVRKVNRRINKLRIL